MNTRSSPRWQTTALPLLAVLIVQTWLVGHGFPWRELLTETPILGIDHPFHLYQLAVAKVLGEQGRLTGYDPFFAAGYVGGVTFNASGKAPALLYWLFRDVLSELQVYKLYVFGAAVIAPLAAVAAAVYARLPARQAWLCGALAIGLWWASGVHWYHTAGLVAFVVVSFLALPYCALLDRLMNAPRATGLVVLLGLGGAILFLTHPFIVIPIAVFGVARLITARPAVSASRLAARLLAVGILALLPNLPWMLAMRGEASIGASQFSLSYQMAVDARLFWMELLGITREPSIGGKINPLLFVLACLSFWRLDRSLRGLNLALVATWATLVLFAAFGAALPFIGSVQPNRFSSTAYVFLIVPAALGANALLSSLRTPAPRLRYAAFAGVVVLGLLGAVVALETEREATLGDYGRYGAAPPEVRGLGPKGRAVLDWLQTSTGNDGRVLFETSLARVHDGGHIVGYLAMQSGRQFVGGPYNNFFAGTRDGWMFGRPLESIEPAQFVDYLRLFNIGWIVVHSKVAKEYLARFPDQLETGAAFEGLQTFKVAGKLDFVQSGQAHLVSAQYGKLVVQQDGPIGRPFVLKFHYVPGLHAVDGSPVEPVLLMDDPTPFVRVTPRSALIELVR